MFLFVLGGFFLDKAVGLSQDEEISWKDPKSTELISEIKLDFFQLS